MLLHILHFSQTLMERTLGRHSLIFSWWHTHTWSRRRHRSDTFQESSASNFTSHHDTVVLSAEAPFYLGFRESSVACKCCGLLMYQFASLGLAVNWCETVSVFWYSVTLVSPSLARSKYVYLHVFRFLHEVFHLLSLYWMFSPILVPGGLVCKGVDLKWNWGDLVTKLPHQFSHSTIFKNVCICICGF